MGAPALLLAMVSFFFAPFPLDTIRDQGVVMVRGTVIDRPSHRPVPGVVVYAVRERAGVQTALSDRRGNFYFLRLQPGTYGLAVAQTVDPQDWCDVWQSGKQLSAGFEYVANVYVGRGCQ